MATTVKDLRSTLETEARNLSKHRDRLRGELDRVEAQLTARLEAAANLARIRPLDSVDAPKAAAKRTARPAAKPTAKAAPRAGAKAGAKAAAKPAPKTASKTASKAAARKAPAKTATAATRSGASRATASVKPAKKAAAKKTVAKKTAAKKTASTRPAGRKTSKPAQSSTSGSRHVRTHLRDDIANVLDRSKVSMNVREIVEALDEPLTKSRLESVRTSAEGLVKAGRATKPKRGQFASS